MKSIWGGRLVPLVGALMIIGAAPAQAAVFPVTNTNDAGTESLRAAITAANENGNTEVDQIPITATGVINLQSTPPNISTPTTITGPGPYNLTVRRQTGDYPIFRVFQGTGETVRIENLTVADGVIGINAGGAGLLELENLRIRGNVSGSGTGVQVIGGTATIRNSAIFNNQGNFGGGIRVDPGSVGTSEVTISNTTIAGNSATQFGGGISASGSSIVEITSSTVVGNKADSDDSGGGDGGGIYNDSTYGSLFGNFRIGNTILANNLVGGNQAMPNRECLASTHPVTSYGYNLRTTADPGCIGFTSLDYLSPNALIGPLADNGGPAETVALLPGSPAIDTGVVPPAAPYIPLCPATDQRGLPRGVTEGRCDIGAFEVQGNHPPSVVPTTPAGNKKKCKKKKKRKRAVMAKKKKRCKKKRK
jgi:hypothetical protein